MSVSGERRGGRKKGTPNKATALRQQKKALADGILSAMVDGDIDKAAELKQQLAELDPATATDDDSIVDAASGADADRVNKPAHGNEEFTGDAHAFLVKTYQDSRLTIGTRLDAAKAAIRFEKPALATQAITITPDPAQELRDVDRRRDITETVAHVLQAVGIVLPKPPPVIDGVAEPAPDTTQEAALVFSKGSQT